jgi:NAD(P)H-quinone oxidoreductase subunit 4
MDASLSLPVASSATFPWLSLIVLLPAAAALVMPLLPGDASDPKLPRTLALLTLLADLGLMLWCFSRLFQGDQADLQLVERVAWVPALGLEWSLGADGLSAPLVVLSGLVTLLSACCCCRPRPRAWCSSPKTSCCSSWRGSWSWCRSTC